MVILIVALAAAATPTGNHRRHHALAHHAAEATARAPEHLHISAINLTDQDGTILTIKDAAGHQLKPVRIPLTMCHKDHLGRLLPGNDVDMPVDETKGPDGVIKRSVTSSRFAALCAS